MTQQQKLMDEKNKLSELKRKNRLKTNFIIAIQTLPLLLGAYGVKNSIDLTKTVYSEAETTINSEEGFNKKTIGYINSPKDLGESYLYYESKWNPTGNEFNEYYKYIAETTDAEKIGDFVTAYEIWDTETMKKLLTEYEVITPDNMESNEDEDYLNVYYRYIEGSKEVPSTIYEKGLMAFLAASSGLTSSWILGRLAYFVDYKKEEQMEEEVAKLERGINK